MKYSLNDEIMNYNESFYKKEILLITKHNKIQKFKNIKQFPVNRIITVLINIRRIIKI